MTDNEKRAHDFAVALVPLMTDFPRARVRPKGGIGCVP